MKDFGRVALPLYDLLRKGEDWFWGEAQRDAFRALQTALCSEPVLAFPDFEKPFIIHVDACKRGLGAVLCQEHDGHERVVCYYSRFLKGAERNYTTSEQECLAFVVAMKQFRPYLYGREFTVFTDHHALQWLHNITQPNGRMTRWALLLGEYKFTVKHKPGKSNCDADALSRYGMTASEPSRTTPSLNSTLYVRPQPRRALAQSLMTPTTMS